MHLILFLLPALNPKSYGRARVLLEAPRRPMLVIGRSFYEEKFRNNNRTITGEETGGETGEETITG